MKTAVDRKLVESTIEEPLDTDSTDYSKPLTATRSTPRRPPRRRPNWFAENQEKLWLGVLGTIALAFASWVGVTVFGLNREVGELKSEIKRLEDELNHTKDDLNTAKGDLRRDVERLGDRLDRAAPISVPAKK